MALIMPAPLVAGFWISRDLGIRFYAGFRLPLFILGEYIAIQVMAYVFRDPIRPLFSNRRDYVVSYLALVLFSIVAFSPEMLGVADLVLCLSIPVAIALALSAAYILGSPGLRRGMIDFPKQFSRKPRRRSS